MKIGIYDPYLDDIGGGEKYMMTIAECLSENHQVEIFWDNSQDLQKIIQRFNLNLSRVKTTANIFSKSYPKFKRILETQKYDALIMLSDGSIPISLSRKTFISFQQPLPNVSPNLKTSLKLKRISTIFCNSEFTKSYIDKELGIESIVVYPPVNVKPRKAKRENIIMHVGRFRDTRVRNNDYKRQGLMVKCFIEMVDRGLKNWEFVLCVGLNKSDEANFNSIREKAKGYPIKFLINLTNDDLWDIYSKAKIYWHATGFGDDLEKHPEFAEHFGISTVEAMGAGCVPVVINAGGQKEIVQDGQNGYVWDNIEQLQSKTLDLINNQSKLLKMQEKAKVSANRFSKDRFCNDINELINK